MTLEEHLSRIAMLIEAKRATNWTLGDQYAECVKEFGRSIIGQLAELARCSKEHISQCIRVSVAFPNEYRDATVDWSMYRECLLAAKRGNRDPAELMQECLSQEMSLSEIRLLYRNAGDKPPVLRFAARCDGCGSRVIVYCPPELKGAIFECPVCAVMKNEMRFLGKVE